MAKSGGRLSARFKDKDNIELASKVGELQQTMDQLGMLKRGDCRVQRKEAAEARRIPACWQDWGNQMSSILKYAEKFRDRERESETM